MSLQVPQIISVPSRLVDRKLRTQDGCDHLFGRGFASTPCNRDDWQMKLHRLFGFCPFSTQTPQWASLLWFPGPLPRNYPMSVRDSPYRPLTSQAVPQSAILYHFLWIWIKERTNDFISTWRSGNEGSLPFPVTIIGARESSRCKEP